MDGIIQAVLMFFFFQFLVVLGVMVAAILVARPEVPVWGREPGRQAMKRGFAFVVGLPGRALRILLRMCAMPTAGQASRDLAKSPRSVAAPR